MIEHAIERNQFLAFSGDDSGHVFLQFLATGLSNHTSAARDSEDNVQIDLCVRVGHYVRPYMALLVELITDTVAAGYKHVVPTVLFLLERCLRRG